MHRDSLRYLVVPLFFLAAQVRAGEIIGNTFIGERFGYIELTSVDGKWEIVDREKDANNDMAGPVADFKFKEPISGVKPVTFNALGFRKVDQSITVDFLIKTLRDAWSKQGGEMDSVEAGRISGKKVWITEKRITLKGNHAHGRDILLEGEKAVFVISVVVLAAAYPEYKRLLEELAASAKY